MTGTEPRPEQPGDSTSWYEKPWYEQPGYQYHPGYTVYPYPPPYHPTPPDDRTRTMALASLASNIAMSAVCCPLGIAGVVVSAIALRRCERDPVSARRLVAWSWVALVVSLVAGLIALALIIVLEPPSE